MIAQNHCSYPAVIAMVYLPIALASYYPSGELISFFDTNGLILSTLGTTAYIQNCTEQQIYLAMKTQATHYQRHREWHYFLD